MKNILIQGWKVYYDGTDYYTVYMNAVYIKEIIKYYETVFLLCPVVDISDSQELSYTNLSSFEGVRVLELPNANSYVGLAKYFLHYFKAYRNIKDIDVFYARYPTPFGWLAKTFHNDKKRIIHFVGDPIDVTKNSPNLNFFIKQFKLFLFQPEHRLYLWACKGAKVYTNGFHIAERLHEKGIEAQGLMSSTLNSSDFYIDVNKEIDTINPKLIYLGYLRKAKGIDTVIRALELLQEKIPNAQLTIVGTGEYESGIRELVKSRNIPNVNFIGHIDDREELNNILRNHDVFTFASLSEGSPRVVLEAMANGLPVISTPVGSLPTVFNDKEDIIFTNYNDFVKFNDKLKELIYSPELFSKIRKNGFNKVKKFKIDTFIKKVFQVQ